MQNRYAGDVGDFGKIGLLRQLAAAGYHIGVNWYLAPDESHNEDGKHIGYLSSKQFDGCDDVLRTALGDIVFGQRSIVAIEDAELIPNAAYYHQPLLPPSDAFSRKLWHEAALSQLQSADIVFLDPDNGLLVKSVSPTGAKSCKSLFQQEVVDYYAHGQSVIFYNHRCREQEEVYLQRFMWLFHTSELSNAEITALKYSRGSTRDYICLMQTEHSAGIKDVINQMMQSNWKRHFSTLEMHL